MLYQSCIHRILKPDFERQGVKLNQRIVAGIISFTKNGRKVAEDLKLKSEGFLFEEKPMGMELSFWIQKAFQERMPLVFISALGIAVRYIAPFVDNKLLDSPVIVIDELGEHVIPVLSGHFGGANAIAKALAKTLDAKAVITTATDLHQMFAVDVFAKKNGLWIENKDEIKRISSKLLNGDSIRVASCIPVRIEGDVPANLNFLQYKNTEKTTSLNESVDVRIDDAPKKGFTLMPKRLVLGMGCKKNISFEALLQFVSNLYSPKYLRENLYAIATIDVKENEIGLIKLAQYFGAQFFTYSAKELEGVKGEFPDSSFVKETVGVSNVCERAAVLGAGLDKRELEREKTSGNGITLAAAKRKEIVLRF